MCGILGYVGSRPAQPILLGCLRDISYRGYDSCGLTLLGPDGLSTVKTEGSVERLHLKVDGTTSRAMLGIAHTRWATHGEPSELNAHPHTDCRNEIAVVHNGIVENFQCLKEALIRKQHVFRSDTDTEVIPHLIEEHMSAGQQLTEAVQSTSRELRGAFAFVVVCSKEPGTLVAVRYDCPLIVGIGDHGFLAASDVAAIMDYCDRFVILENEQVATISRTGLAVTNLHGDLIEHVVTSVDWTKEQAQKGGYDTFLLKEIHEQPMAVADTLRGRLAGDGSVALPEIEGVYSDSNQIDNIVLVACGSASYACAFGKVVLEELTGIPVLHEVGSEYRYRKPALSAKTLFIVISQSGETADTIACLRMAKRAGARTIALVNVVGTTLAREADAVLYTRAGPEIAVPATKSLLAQMACMDLIGISIAQKLGSVEEPLSLGKALNSLPPLIGQVLADGPRIKDIAGKYAKAHDWYVIGRGIDETIAREGALKLKEIAYIHAESIAGGELKHGPIALIDEGMPIVAISTQQDLRTKMLNNMQEVRARRGIILTIAGGHDQALEDISAEVIYVPSIAKFIDPILAIVPLQLIAYYCGILQGADVDHPRNLAKTVTVE